MKKMLCMFLIGIIAFGIVGCGNISTPKETANDFASAFKKADELTLEKIYIGDTKNIVNGIHSDSFGEEVSKMLTEKTRNFDFKVTNENITDNAAIVNIDITAYNLGDVMTSGVTEYMNKVVLLALSTEADTESQMNEIMSETFISKLEKCKKDYKKEITLNLTKVDGVWKVDDLSKNQEFSNAITGNMVEAIKKISQNDENNQKG